MHIIWRGDNHQVDITFSDEPLRRIKVGDLWPIFLYHLLLAGADRA
ncbi:hypothetical protein VP96_02126 [Vibrio cholerae]|nr:hypothetical protein VP96_02126 [Vibrio cholerae]